MATYELSVDDVIWDRWVDSLPAEVTPDRRIAELLLADLEGRVGEDAAGGDEGPAGAPPYGCPMCEETFDDLDVRDRHLLEAHDLAPI